MILTPIAPARLLAVLDLFAGSIEDAAARAEFQGNAIVGASGAGAGGAARGEGTGSIAVCVGGVSPASSAANAWAISHQPAVVSNNPAAASSSLRGSIANSSERNSSVQGKMSVQATSRTVPR